MASYLQRKFSNLLRFETPFLESRLTFLRRGASIYLYIFLSELTLLLVFIYLYIYKINFSSLSMFFRNTLYTPGNQRGMCSAGPSVLPFTFKSWITFQNTLTYRWEFGGNVFTGFVSENNFSPVSKDSDVFGLPFPYYFKFNMC